jgi:thiol-disulfide isomerase/thioredoxin
MNSPSPQLNDPSSRTFAGRVARLSAGLIVALLGSALPAATAPLPVSGLWDATVEVGAIQVPFRFGIAADGAKASGWFFNAQQRVVSSSGALEANHLTLEFASYARRLDATLGADGTLAGTYAPTTPGSSAPAYAFHAQRATSVRASADRRTPIIGGLWLLPIEGRKAGEQAWRFIVRQSGADVTSTILRVDGDSGALTGRWQDGKLLLSHFDGARPSLIEVTPGPDQTLHLLVRDPHGSDVALTAYRPAAARARGLPEATDPGHHTSVRDPDEPFYFSFPNLDGQVITSTDRRFRGKVLVVDIAGSWCPNCHDEAPFLEALYRKYRPRGLQVVTLAFEESEQLANPLRLRAFIKDYGIDYTVLLAGTPQELHAKLPQAVNLDAFPTTIFIGRDGRVRSVHAGFAAPATGEFNTRLKASFATQIERLLAEKPPTPAATATDTSAAERP